MEFISVCGECLEPLELDELGLTESTMYEDSQVCWKCYEKLEKQEAKASALNSKRGEIVSPQEASY